MLAALAALALIAPLGWFWHASLVPGTYSATAMGWMDFGGGPGESMPMHGWGGMSAMATGTDITTLVAAPGPADVRVTLTARQQQVTLPSGRTFDGFTLNGTTPGPTVHAVQGDLVEVRLVNDDVAEGVTLHWHGIDVPNAMDGVAGVTQDAVGPGQSFTYRFVARDAGTYWYHSHQVGSDQVARGMFGAVVVEPKGGVAQPTDVMALMHTYPGGRTVNGRAGDTTVPVATGTTARVRIVNSDNGPVTVWVSGAGYRVAAVDGTDVVDPGPVAGKGLVVTAGGRADLLVDVPAGGARVELSGAALVLGDGPGPGAAPAPRKFVDLLSYGTPAALPFDADHPDRRFDYDIGRRPGFLDGRPGMWWTINGHLWPDVPMFVVREGDVVRMRIHNGSGTVHPMHLHGHHAVVLSRNGVPASGSPWWTDTLNVRNGETYEIAFLADNPGVWMDHCHNLPHATQGLVTHLMYEGYRTPYVVGGPHHNDPE